MTTINSPSATYSGTSTIGPTTLLFKDGVAEHDGDLPKGVAAYLEAQGFGIDGAAKVSEVPEPVDPRNLTTTQLGSKLRDAAVDPKPVDFLAPSNAGEANPHGPAVVSPEIHASEGVRPVRPGDVPEPANQEANELKHAATIKENGAEPAVASGQPAGNASRSDWFDYAVANGHQPDSLEDFTRDEIRDLYNK